MYGLSVYGSLLKLCGDREAVEREWGVAIPGGNAAAPRGVREECDASCRADGLANGSS